MSKTLPKPYFSSLHEHSFNRENKKSSNIGKIFVILFVLVVFGLISTGNLSIGAKINFGYMVAIGASIYILSLFNIKYGLAATVVGFSLSPDIPVGGVELRLEDFMIPFLAFAWFFKNMSKHVELVATPLKKPFLSIAILGLSSTVIALAITSLNHNAAMQYYFKHLEYLVLFFLALNILETRQDIYFILITLLVSSAFMGIFGTHQVLTKGESFGFRVSGPSGETANILGGYYVFCMAIAAGLFFCSKNPKLKFLLLVYLGGCMLWPLLQTLSRASFVSMVSALIFLGIVGKRQILLWVSGFGIVFPLLFPSYLYDRMRTVLGILGYGDTPTSWADKTIGWGLVWDNQISRNPITVLIGNGVGSINLQIDNEYMKILGETGFLGLILFISMIVITFKMTWKVFKNSENNSTEQGMALGFLGALIALLVQGFSGTVFTTMRTMEPFVLFCALMSILNNIHEKEKKHRHSGKPIAQDHRVPAIGRYTIVEIFRKNYRQPSE